MLPGFLLPETTVHENGTGPVLDIGGSGGLILLTMGIERILEQESLVAGIYGSVDGATWSAAPLIEFPQKFYTGTSAVLLDTGKHPDVRFIRAQWKTTRWGRGSKRPEFQFYIFAEAVAAEAGQTSASDFLVTGL